MEIRRVGTEAAPHSCAAASVSAAAALVAAAAARRYFTRPSSTIA